MFKNLFSKNKGVEEPKEEKVETSVDSVAKEPEFEIPKVLVNKSIGMENCGEMEDMLKEMLEMFVDTKAEKKGEIEEDYKNEDWVNYQIHVHALKSTSLTVGLEPLHYLAKDVELSAKEMLADETKKEQKVAFIKANHDNLMKLYDASCEAATELADSIVVD